MANMSKTKVEMNVQPANVRNSNFEEVALGYTPEQAIEEAQRCLNCRHKPCVSSCPVNVRIPEFIQLVATGEFKQAYDVIKSTNSLPAVCGRVCPQENQCEKVCVRGMKGEAVAIGRLERFCADYVMQNDLNEISCTVQKKNKKVAVIGGGPAGLTCAGDLNELGYDVTIFESLHTPGGVLVYGIPEFRLPKNIVQKEIDTLVKCGVEVKVNSVVGQLYSIDDLKEMGYESVFISTGAGLPRFLNIPGENLNSVFSSNEFLTRINLMKAYKFPETDTPFFVGEKCAVVGGGNVAMDAARTAKRLGAKDVYIIYRRGENEMPARKEEIEHAKEEGIEFKMLTAPIRVIGDEFGMVKQLECVEIELCEPDETGRCKPKLMQDTNFNIDIDSLIIAVGQTPNPMIKNTCPDLKTSKSGCVVVDEQTGKTNLPGVFAGGDVVSGAATVILAMGAGKKAAKAIDEYLTK